MFTFQLAYSDSADPSSLSSAQWIPALVPGGVHESLMAAGIIENPYYSDNEASASWVDGKFWWYSTALTVPVRAAGQRLRLVMHGLDSVATVWIDGVETASHETMFRPLSVEVTTLAAGEHALLICFKPPLDGLTAPASVLEARDRRRSAFSELRPGDADESAGNGIMSANLAMTLRRKPIYSFGWDFAPRIPSIGIWAPVELLRESVTTITGVYARTSEVSVIGRTAVVLVDVETSAVDDDPPVVVEIVAPDGRRFAGTAGRFEIDDAQLWWTHDLGAQPLYDVITTLRSPAGEILDTRRDRIGLRTITVEQPVDEIEGGRLFRFVLNGVPIFARGANWVPASMFPGSVGASKLRALVRTARHGAMNMLRVWGGGLYEPEAFYDACDDEGILLWQDFMFACTDYDSSDPVLAAEVALEAEFQVRRLRNHASLALWCGNNEVHAIHGLTYGDIEPGNWGWSFFHESLPAAVAVHGGATFYWPGSPYGDPAGTNGVIDGDRHAWEVWHGMDVGAGGPTEFASHGEAVHFSRYRYDKGKFISEFGIHAAPELHTLERWTPAGSLALGSAQLNHRNKDNPKDKGYALMGVETGVPTDLAEYVSFSMACQAEGLKFGIEHYRRRQPHCSGTLVWQFNDPWPGITWSVVDYDLVPKAGFYFLQRVHQPVIASFVLSDEGVLELWVTNSSRDIRELSLRVEIPLFAGGLVLEENLQVVSFPGSSSCAWSAPAEQLAAGNDRYAHVSEAQDQLPANRLFFGHLKDLPLDGSVTARIGEMIDGALTVELTAAGYAYFVAVSAPVPGVIYSRNYVDLRDGESVVITLSMLPDDFDATSLQINTWSGEAAIHAFDLVP